MHCSFGDYTAREYLWQMNGFRGMRAHDIAVVIGTDSRLPDELVQRFMQRCCGGGEERSTHGGHLDLAQQIIINSRIANAKFDAFKVAVYLALIGVVPAPFTLVIAVAMDKL